MRNPMKSQLAIAALTVAALTSCGSGSEGGAAIEPSTPTEVSTSLQPQPDTSDVDNASTTSDHTAAPTATTTSTGATTTTTSTTTATSTSSTAAPTTMSIPVEPALVVAQIDSCPTLQFTTLVDGWNPVVENVQGGGSGLPGNHIGGPDSYMNLFAGGSAFGPTTGQAVEVDSYQATRGAIEDGLGVRIDIGEPDCDFFDLTFYGNSESEVSMILDGLKIGL
jgi:hypothetical protein